MWNECSKLKINGEIEKHKAILVARGFMQKEVLDYDGVYSLIATLETVRLIVAIAYGTCWPLFY